MWFFLIYWLMWSCELPRSGKPHTPELRQEALKLAEHIGVTAAAGDLCLYESQPYAG
ncbi:hypothetical protein SARI_00503 [Salmonella enterica subsp. arizonae serovar 62:z4,z23:-]|uniref:Uncharacterized protein n=1 Tax=Salmonella arizonae (strain ATCC BAA-731 / CDC346-86 / RSK2980) TaxID=41514 RepID=A9MIJ3_SALAR|nr:hypothetical protein SARI_00503 [Salmonella enterica subsp. arizonae serovar 62:z4,z23:-]